MHIGLFRAILFPDKNQGASFPSREQEQIGKLLVSEAACLGAQQHGMSLV